MDINCKKFVVDGAPGSGKTTLLFGKTDTLNESPKIPSLSDLGFKIIPEAITKIADDMRKENLVPTDNLEQFIYRTINQSIDDSFKDYDGVYILERGLPGYFFMEKIFKRKLPKRYFDFYKSTNYANPIFILETIADFNMSKTNKELRKGRHTTTAQRKYFFEKTIKIYKELGYKIEIVPVYNKNPKENNKKRIEHILKFIS